MKKVVALFNERHAFHVSQGLSGRAVYEALAADSNLPLSFTTGEAAAIANLKPDAMAKRRYRGMAPTFIAMSERKIDYPRPDFCRWLASLFVDRSAA